MATRTNRQEYDQDKKKVSRTLMNAVLKQVQSRVGKPSAWSKGQYLTALRNSGTPCNERTFRLAIQALRDDKYPICSDSKEHGYWWPAIWDEYEEFSDREFGAKIRTESHTLSQMNAGARELFGEAHQLALL